MDLSAGRRSSREAAAGSARRSRRPCSNAARSRTPLGEGFTVGRIGQEFLDRTLVGPEPGHQEAADIADVALFLMSPAAQRIIGHFVPVDGGQHVRGLHPYWDVAEEQGLVARP